MADDRIQRRLAAILAADVVGYSRLMGRDEEGTLAALTAHRTELIEPCVSKHRGRLVKTTGDGLLVEFASVVDAVRCSVAVQEGMTERNGDVPEDQRIEFRIGVNLGDVIVQDDDLYGDGVNVAARLEALADPGGVVVSDKVQSEVRTKLDVGFDDLGPQAVKNIAEPVQAFRVRIDGADISEVAAGKSTLFSLPAVAVLPFENLSGDPEQEYFSDGMTEDLITALSRSRQFRVIARNSTVSYKGTRPDIRELAKALNVEYVIEGSVRKFGDRLRLSAQLIEGSTGNHLWAKRYDRELQDVFAVQDELAETLVFAIMPELDRSEQQRARTKSPENLVAWDCYQQGMWHFHKNTIEDNDVAWDLFQRATVLDPEFAPAFAALAETYILGDLIGATPRDSGEAMQAARRAVQLDAEDPDAHNALGQMHVIFQDYETAIRELELAIELNPSNTWVYHNLGTALVRSGRAREAIPMIQTGINLAPQGQAIGRLYARRAQAHYFLQELEDCIEWADKAIRYPDVNWPILAYRVSALAHLGRQKDAEKAFREMSTLYPNVDFSIAWRKISSSVPEVMDHFVHGLHKAGLSE